MKIRSVTSFVNVDETLAAESLATAGQLASAARELLPRNGVDLQTTRVAVQPLHEILREIPAVEFAREYERVFKRVGFDYGALLVDSAQLFPLVPEMLRATNALFASIRIASRDSGIDLRAIQAAALAIYALAHTTADGFGNFRFAAAANCPPGVPFFPTAYHDGGAPSFAFATESADLAVEAFTAAKNLDDARERLVASLEREGARLGALGAQLSARFGLKFSGIDFSLAPYPEEARSLATAVEKLTGATFGSHGTLFAVAFITDCLRRANFPRAGFSGVMLPVLEDWTLAVRSQENLYSLDSLLLYSTVCGTGLDTIPLAGDTSEQAIAALLLDLAALAVKLDKLLTARLIPVPGLRGGQVTKFSFAYFANARAFEIGSDVRLKIFDGMERVELG